MLKTERHAYIMKQINLHNRIQSADLSSNLAVSEDTIRRDLHELATAGLILKVHGGALSKSFHYPSQNPSYALDAKKSIAKKAISLIKKDMVVLTGGGTTVIEMARMMPENLEATFFTISPLVALELSDHPRLEVVLLGGKLSKTAQISIGSQVISQLSDLKADICFTGVYSLSANEGLTESDWEVVQVKKAMIKSASKTAVLSISEKLGSVQKLRVGPISDIDYLITEAHPEDRLLDEYRNHLQVI
ncbi:MAG: DeoR/GlpR transcriptional regulator [Mucilaginibacter polytrichastri]|nr:DeoR/GlpR transcriptional regulator [Mucilaginibacter polytrichastri]